jgi:glutathione-regulated potassium-efflux system ancillary protein KefG
MAMAVNIAHPVLVLFAHPAVRKSRVNRRLVETVRGLDGVTVNDLYEAYPDLDIDVAREQKLLAEHDVVVFQHPFYWYSTPAILKEWQDLVLEHGWAYGHGGRALQGKTLVSAISAGGSEDAYRPQGSNRFTVRQLLAPIEQTARLCGMDYLPPFVVFGTFRLTAREIDGHVRDYRRLVEGLRDGLLTAATSSGLQRLNAEPDALLGG